MKLVNAILGIDIPFEEGKPEFLILENTASLNQFIREMNLQCSGESGNFLLSEGKELKIAKVCQFLLEPFTLDLNSKKIMTLLYRKLGEAGEGYLEQKSRVLSESLSLIDQCIVSSGIQNLTCNADFSWNDLFKLLDVKIDTQYENLLDKMISYLKILADLGEVRLLAVLNFAAFFEREELQEIIRMARYLKINILFVEKREPKDWYADENRYIIDKDNCIIVRKSQVAPDNLHLSK